jgi:hypothetical protein
MTKFEFIKEAAEIRDDRIGWLIGKVQAHNAKAVKLGFPPAKLTEAGEAIKVRVLFNDEHCRPGVKEGAPVKAVYHLIPCELEYTIPVIDGWELISVFDLEGAPKLKDEDGEFIIDENGNNVYGERMVFTSTVPDKELPAEYLDKHEIYCEHCGHKRFRTHSMLMRDTNTGEYKEVGSTCVKDFFGHDPKNLMWIAQFRFKSLIESDPEYGMFGFDRGSDLDTMTVMSFAALAIRQFGWTSRSVAYDKGTVSTSDDVLMLMNPPIKFSGEVEPTEEDISLARAALEHFENLDPGTNDYLMNCHKVAKLGYVPNKMFGVACSMVATYRRRVQKVLDRKKYPESQWVGEIGDKIEARVKCMFFIEIEGYYGVNDFYIFLNEETGEAFKTYYSGTKWSVEQGETCTIKGTVKRHDTDSTGRKTTTLTRVNATDIKEADDA